MLKLLIVDDEKRTREYLRKCIPWQSLNITSIQEAEDGDLALKAASIFKPDIILTDVRMPRMTGIEFATLLRQQLPHCKLIFISGYTDKEYLKSAIRLKAVSYVEKPLVLEDLIAAVESAVSEHTKEIMFREQDEALAKLPPATFMLTQKICLALCEQGADMEQIREMLQHCRMSLPIKGSYVTVIIKPGLQWIADAIGQILSEKHWTGLTAIKNDNSFICHLNLQAGLNVFGVKKVFEAVILDLLEHPSAAVELKNNLFIGIGAQITGVDNIYLSCQTALQALHKAVFTGNSRLVLHEEKESQPYKIASHDFECFDNFLSKGDKNGAIGFINQLTEKIRRYDRIQIDDIKQLYYKLLTLVEKNAEKKDIDLNKEQEEGYCWKVISEALTLRDLKEYLTSRIEAWFEELEKKGTLSRTVFTILEYIHSNFSKPLTTSDISEHVGLTPSYICNIFKKETGKTIIDYINEYRISKAKSFLKDRSIKLYEVARLCGYSDVKYFTKTFKKTTGITPSDFREVL